MEITKTNFNEFLPEIQEAINDCLFVSIDSELTGLNTVPNSINTFDTPAQYYTKFRKCCKEFLVIQYGLSIFKYDKSVNKFKQRTYNFFIFRRPVDRNIPDQRFLCQTTSIDFLISQGFDFNKLFKDGISYMNVNEEENYKNNIEEQRKKLTELKKDQQQGQNNSIISVPEKDRPFIDDIVQQIETFIKNSDDELELPKCNSFVRRLIYQTVHENYAGKVSLETRTVVKDRILFLTRPKSTEEEKQIQEKAYNDKLKELDDYVGFTKVLRLIVESRKLVVGHNLYLDLLHTIDKFLTPLPENYEEFKEVAHSLFPNILDTKYMSSEEPFKDLIVSNVLKPLFDTVSEKPFKIPSIEIVENCGYDLKESKEHEAGFDAYITGLSFLSMWKYLGMQKNLSDSDIFNNFDLLSPYLNKVFLMKLADNQFMNLSGDDIKPARDHVFYLIFPKNWKTSDIIQLFSPFGNVYVAWIDETSAYVSLHKKEEANSVLKLLSSTSTNYKICRFSERFSSLKTNDDKKRKSSTPVSSTPAKSMRLSETKSQDQHNTSKVLQKTFSESCEWE